MYEDRIKWIEHKGKRILFSDYSNLSSEELLKVMQKEVDIVNKEPINSILHVGDFTNIHFSVNLVSGISKFNQENSKYYKASALLGVKGLIKVMYDSVSKFLKQDMKLFNTKEEALEWLASR